MLLYFVISVIVGVGFYQIYKVDKKYSDNEPSFYFQSKTFIHGGFTELQSVLFVKTDHYFHDYEPLYVEGHQISNLDSIPAVRFKDSLYCQNLAQSWLKNREQISLSEDDPYHSSSKELMNYHFNYTEGVPFYLFDVKEFTLYVIYVIVVTLSMFVIVIIVYQDHYRFI